MGDDQLVIISLLDNVLVRVQLISTCVNFPKTPSSRPTNPGKINFLIYSRKVLIFVYIVKEVGLSAC